MAHEVVLAAAFSAGVATAFSPCAAVLLPTYVSYYLSRPDEGERSGLDEPPRALPRRLTLGLVGLMAGFVLLVVALAIWVLTFGEWTPRTASLFLLGGLALGLGAFVTSDGMRSLEPSGRRFLRSHLASGLRVGGMASLGVASVYVALGMALVLAIGVGLRGVPEALPRVAFASAAIVVVLGVLMLLNKNVLSFLPKLRAPRGRGLRSFYLFGAGYGLIASGCFLPVFISVLAAALPFGVAESLQVFLVYALGSAAVFMLVTLSASMARGAAFRVLRSWRPHVRRVAGAIIIATGAYVMWFDWTNLLSRGL
jgi:cytochrome c biogenesis protein CcdA